MKHKPKPVEEKAILDPKFMVGFGIGFAVGVVITLFVVVLIRGGV